MLSQLASERPGYPWLVVGLTMLAVVVSNGMGNAGLTVFDETLLSEFDWSVGQLKIRDAINFIGAGCLVFAAGFVLDRVGFKPLLLLGMVAMFLVYRSYPYIQNLTQLYWLHGLVAIAIAAAGNMVAMITAATWMPERRGLAVGITIAGTSVGGMVLPPLGVFLNETVGWRSALASLSWIPFAMAIAIFLLLRNRVAAQDSEKAKTTQGTTFHDALRTRAFWLVAIAGAATYYAILALYANLFLYLRSLSYSPAQAGLGLSVLAFTGLAGKLGAGWLADHMNPYRLFKACMFIMLVGLAIAAQGQGWVYWGLAITGIGWGSLHTLYNFVLLALFGLRAAGRINGSISVAEAIGGGIGIYTAGALFDLYGSYQNAFVVILTVMTIGCVVTLGLNPIDRSASKANR